MSVSYSLDDYGKAKAAVAAIDEKSVSYTGNNPNKFRSEQRLARDHLRLVEGSLKNAGILPLTDQERLQRELDRAFPEAQSKQVVEFQGVRYQRRYTAAERSNSGKTVTRWDARWERVE